MGSDGKISTHEIEDEACLLALQVSTINVLPAILNAAIELNLFEIIAKGNPLGGFMTSSEIASQLPNQYPSLPNKLERMLRLLTSHSLLTSSMHTGKDGAVERLYGLSPVGKYFVRDEDGHSLVSFTHLCSNREVFETLLNCKEAILDDDIDLFKKVHGKSMFEFMETDQKLNQAINNAMADLSSVNMKKILQIYKGFEGISTLVDVGGGIGLSLKMVVSKYPLIKGINFDLPQVIQDAPSYHGLEHVGGDMFKSVPKGDAIMMKFVCHDWDDEKCLILLKNCHKVLPQNGKVILIDMIMPEVPETTTAAQYASSLDNIMFMQAGGRERTEKEFEALCKSSGFSSFQLFVVLTPSWESWNFTNNLYELWQCITGVYEINLLFMYSMIWNLGFVIGRMYVYLFGF